MKIVQKLIILIIFVIAGHVGFGQGDSVMIRAAVLNVNAAIILDLNPSSEANSFEESKVIAECNETIAKELPELLRDKNILKYNIDSLFSIGFIHVTKSEDGKLRVFNWFANYGGSWQIYYEVIQYIGPDSIYVSEAQEAVGTSNIYQFTTSEGVFYLAEEAGRTCNTCEVYAATAFRIINNKPEICEDCIEGREGSIALESRMGNVKEFGYNPKTKIFTVHYITDDLSIGEEDDPEFEDPEGEEIWETYKFDGKIFRVVIE